MKIIYPFCLFICISTVSFCQTYITNVTIVDVEKQKLIPESNTVATITGNLFPEFKHQRQQDSCKSK